MIDGGSGTDYLSISRSASTIGEVILVDGLSGGSFTLSGGTVVSGMERVDFDGGSGNDRATFTNLLAVGAYFNGAGGADRVTVDYSGFGIPIWFGQQNTNWFRAQFNAGAADHAIDMYYTEEFDITGGAGDDTFYAAGASWVSFKGGAGNDSFEVATVAAGLIDGGSGTDYLGISRGGSSTGEVVRTDGLNGSSFTLSDGTVVKGIERLQFDGGSGNDRATFTNVNAAGDTFNGNGGTDRVTINYSGFSTPIWFGLQNTNWFRAQFNAGAADHAVDMYNTEEFDITGGSGSDYLDAGSASWARLTAGAGNDYLVTGSGNDELYGGSGNDTMSASTGSDILYGGDGDDTLTVGSGGVDHVYGGLGFDRLSLDVSHITANVVIGNQIAGEVTLPEICPKVGDGPHQAAV